MNMSNDAYYNTLKLVRIVWCGVLSHYELRTHDDVLVRARKRKAPLIKWAKDNNFYIKGIIEPAQATNAQP